MANDFVPTPPFATRALFECVAPAELKNRPKLSGWEPAAGQGHMAKAMGEYFPTIATDKYEHPGCLPGVEIEQEDFLLSKRRADVIITNPPYSEAGPFMLHGLKQANQYFACLMRVQSLETQGRYQSIYKQTPPTRIAFFSDRIPFKSGKVVRKAPKMFFHVWLFWDLIKVKSGTNYKPEAMWVRPDVQRLLERDTDYV